MAAHFTARELEELAAALRDLVIDFTPERALRHRYEPVLAADEVVAEGADLVITFDDGRSLRYQPCEEE